MSGAGRREETEEEVARAFYAQLRRSDFSGREWFLLTVAHCHTDAMEAFLGAWFVLWGTWVASPWWSVAGTSPGAYRVLLYVFRDELWLGASMSAVGAWMLCSLWQDSKLGRWLACVLAAFLTGAMASSFALSDVRSPAFLLWGLTSGSLTWVQARLKDKYISVRRGY